MSAPGRFQILAICSGNVCRSPLAELLLQRELRTRADFVVASAGTIARPGQRMTAEMVQVAVGLGLAPELPVRHEAIRLAEHAVEQCDLILGLTREHRAAAVALHPAAVKRAFTLVEFARLAGTVGSPETPLTPADLVTRAFAARGPRSQPDRGGDEIDDPIGRSQGVYERVAGEVSDAVHAVAQALLRTSAGPSRRAQSPRGGPSLRFSFRPS